jgi:hypothetical protein
MNPLLLDLSPGELETVASIRRRLQGRVEQLRQSLDELGERRPLMDRWLEYSRAPVGMANSTELSWDGLRSSLTAERDALAHSQEELRRCAAILREAGELLGSFLDLVSSGFQPAAAIAASMPTTSPRPAVAAEPAGPPAPAEPAALAEWRTLARASLEANGPLHYKEIYRKIRTQGVVFGGAHPAGTFLATLSRDPGFVRVGRGVYWLAGQRLPDAPPVAVGRRRQPTRGAEARRGVG